MSQMGLVTYNKDKKFTNFENRGYVARGTCDISVCRKSKLCHGGQLIKNRAILEFLFQLGKI